MAPSTLAPRKLAPLTFARLKLAPDELAFVKLNPRRSSPLKSIFASNALQSPGLDQVQPATKSTNEAGFRAATRSTTRSRISASEEGSARDSSLFIGLVLDLDWSADLAVLCPVMALFCGDGDDCLDLLLFLRRNERRDVVREIQSFYIERHAQLGLELLRFAVPI